MRRRAHPSTRVLPDGSVVQNRLLCALPTADFERIAAHVRLRSKAIGETLHEQGRRVLDVYFPNSGVFSVTNRMRDGTLIEVATVGREGMLGVGLFLGDRSGAGRTFQQVPDGPVATLRAARFVKEARGCRAFHDLIARYTQATLLQTMQSVACNALHDVTQRCCRWLLQTHDRVDTDDFPLKHEFLAVMLGVRRPTVTVVLDALQRTGVIASGYGRIQVLKRRTLEARSCECYDAIRQNFVRLGL